MNDVDLLRKAAATIREQNNEHRGYIDRTLIAVARWFDETIEWGARDEPEWQAAVATARAYLGETSS